jgi:hypothetical protein
MPPVSRRHQLMRNPLRWASLVAVSGLAALTLTGCGAGQITQTDTQVAAVNGASGDVDGIALRDALLPYPKNPDGNWPAGSSIPLQVTIVNDGTTPDTLVAVRTSAASRVQVQGRTMIPAGTSVVSITDGRSGEYSAASASAAPASPPSSTPAGEPSAAPSAEASAAGSPSSGSASAAPPSPLDVGVLHIVLADTTRELHAGLNTDITFVFQRAGSVTLSVPMGPPSHNDGGHS